MGEKVAKDNGIGWDGEIYLNTIQHFTDNITANAYDKYSIQRIFPYCLLNVAFKVMDVSPSRILIFFAAGLLSLVALSLCVIYFFRISNFLKWNTSTEIIAFSSFFYSYPILKVLGYYILQSDIFGFLFGIMMLYYYLNFNRWRLVLIGVIGAFVWPTVFISAFALAFFPSDKMKKCDQFKICWDKYTYYSVLFIGMLSPFLIYLCCLIVVGSFTPMLPFRKSLPLTCPANEYWIPISCVCSCMYLYYIIHPFRVSTSDFFRNLCSRKYAISFLCFLLLSLLMKLVLNFLSNQNDGAVKMSYLIRSVVLQSMTDPFVFIENHFWFYGPCFLLIIMLWNKTSDIILSYGAGYLFVVAIGMFLSLTSESRVNIMYLPFLIVPVINYINLLNLRTWVPLIYAMFSLALSRFWFRLNVAGMDYFLSWDNYENYVKFPAQRYFMSTGRWQSHEMYYYIMPFMILCMIFLYVGCRKKIFVSDANEV